MAWLGPLLGALPALISGGIDAFRQRRAELTSVTAPTHKKTELEDDAELARRASRSSTPTKPE